MLLKLLPCKSYSICCSSRQSHPRVLPSSSPPACARALRLLCVALRLPCFSCSNRTPPRSRDPFLTFVVLCRSSCRFLSSSDIGCFPHSFRHLSLSVSLFFFQGYFLCRHFSQFTVGSKNHSDIPSPSSCRLTCSVDENAKVGSKATVSYPLFLSLAGWWAFLLGRYLRPHTGF